MFQNVLVDVPLHNVLVDVLPAVQLQNAQPVELASTNQAPLASVIHEMLPILIPLLILVTLLQLVTKP